MLVASYVSVFIEIDTFMQQGCVKLVKSESKDIYKVSKIYISNKSSSSKLSIH